MRLSTRLVAFTSNTRKLNATVFRNYASISERELEVPTFCDIYIDLPFNVRLKPLNIHKYHNCDKLIIQMDDKYESFVEHDINGNRVEIFTNGNQNHNVSSDIYCSVKAPVKANLNIKSRKDIIVGYFNGDKLHVKSSEGNIFVDKFQGNSVKLKTNNGNINLKEFIQASSITAEIKESGSIICGRLQSLDMNLRTKTGDISVESSYSTESRFEADSGNLDLHNVHKSCQFHLKEGNIHLTGFDGDLKMTVENGSADIHLSRINQDSEINIINGNLNLKLGDACQDYVEFKIHGKICDIAENVKSAAKKIKDGFVLTPDINNDRTVLVNCSNGTVNVESASWQDMIKAKLMKR